MSSINSMLSDFFSKISNRSQQIAKFIKPEELSELSLIYPPLLDYYPYEVKQSKGINLKKIYNSFYTFLKRLSKFYPILLIIDDADNMDDKIIKMLEYLTNYIVDLPILIILTYEKYEKKSNTFTISKKIKLEPLNHINIKNIVFKLFKRKQSTKFNNWLYNKTKGNPFYIEEIIKSLSKMNIISFQKNKWNIRSYYEDYPLQPSLISFIQNKLKKLDKDKINFLKIIYVLGNNFTIDDIDKLQNQYSKENILSILHLLELDGIIDKNESMNYKFHHAIFQKILNTYFKNNEIRDLHRKAAGIIEKSYPDDFENIAFHKTHDLTPKEYSSELVKYLIKTSDLLKKQQNWIKAKQYITLAKRMSKSIHNISEKELLQIDIKVIQLNSYIGEELPHINYIYSLIDKLLQIEEKKEIFSISSIYIQHLIDNFKFDEAEKLLNKNLQLISEDEVINKWKLKYQFCLLTLKRGNINRAIERSEKLIEEIDSKISPLGEWYPTNLLAGINYFLGNLEIAEKYYSKSLEILKIIPKAKDNLATTYGNLSLIYIEFGKINLAVEYSLKYLDIEMKLGNNYKIAKANDFLSSAYLAKSNFFKAKKHAMKFNERALKSNKDELVLESYLKLFGIYFQEKNYEKAKEILNNLSTFQDKFKTNFYNIDIILSKAKISYIEKQYNTSIDLINTCIEICENKNLIIKRADSLSLRALVYALKDKKTKSKEDFNKAKKIFKTKGAKYKLYKLYISMGFNFKGKENDLFLLKGLKLLKEFVLIEEVIKIKDNLKEKKYPLSFVFLENFFIKQTEEIKGKDLQIFTFGGLSIKDQRNQEQIPTKTWGSKKAKELLGLLLVLSPKKGVTREIVSSHLWSEKCSKEAQNNFHVTLSHLRKVIGIDSIICEESLYKLNNKKLWVDYFEFIKLDKEYSLFLKQSKFHKAEEIVRKLINLYDGEFLPEMYTLPIDDEKVLLKLKIKEHLLWLIELLKERLEWKEVLLFSKKLLQINPTDERAHRYIIISLFEQGDRSGVIKHYKRLKSILRAELDVDPEIKTTNLLTELNINIK